MAGACLVGGAFVRADHAVKALADAGPAALYENGPIGTAVLYADGQVVDVPTEQVTRAMCGTVEPVSDRQLRAWGAMNRAWDAEPVGFVGDGTVGGKAHGSRGAGLDLVLNLASPPSGAAAAAAAIEVYVESQFADPVQVTVSIGFANLGPGVVGVNTTFFTAAQPWSTVRPALVGSMGLDSDDVIQPFLPTGTIPVRYDGSLPIVTNEDRVFLTRANFKAFVGSVVGNAAAMTFNSGIAWDFDPSDGVPEGLVCFRSVLAHELGHVLGFTSAVGVRVLDIDLLDVFRFRRTDGSGDENPDDFAEFTIAPRLVDLDDPSDDINVDVISSEYRMSDGVPFSANHFREQSSNIGLMDPAIGTGETFAPDYFRASDLTMLDAIGWDYPPPVPPDTQPPIPDPMVFATAPTPINIGNLMLNAFPASDDSPPVEFFFEFVSGGAGGNSIPWQTSNSANDNGLQPNTQYCYRVKARDSAAPPNETALSPVACGATHIVTPTGIVFGTVTASTVELTATGFLNNLDIGLSGVYFDSTTPGGDGSLNVWVHRNSTVATGLSSNTSYTFVAKARNQDGVETDFGPPATVTTAVAQTDCNGDGMFTIAGDLACFVNALRGIDTIPPGGIARSDYNGDGVTNGEDIAAFVVCAVDGCP